MSDGGNGRAFWKMSGSGNDFVFLDARGSDVPDELEREELIAALCRPHLGVGADGVVFITDSTTARFAIRYYNADGSRAALCGNASLCAAQSAVRLGLAVRDQRFHLMSDAGPIEALVGRDGEATVRLAAVEAFEQDAGEAIEGDELRIGFAVVGVPHLVVLVQDAEAVDVAARGRALRYGPRRAPAGANVNFVSAVDGGPWQLRTYERGVEAETFACGTGAIATTACLVRWGLVVPPPVSPMQGIGASVALRTASGSVLRASLPVDEEAGWTELSGEGRLVYEGVLHSYR